MPAAAPNHLLDHQPWSPRRWISSILAVFVLQTLILMYLSRHQGDDPPSVPLRTSLHLAADPWTSQQLALLQTYRDPTLFALPNVNSFSGAGWLKFRPTEHHFLEWHEPPPWLELAEEDLGDSFHQYIDQSASTPMRIADKPLSPRQGTELLIPSLPLLEQSFMHLAGGLAGLVLREEPRLRSWHHSEILSNTSVRVVIDPRGHVFSVTLAATSGLADADRYALNMAQTARFIHPPAPDSPRRGDPNQPGSDLDWGWMVFHWHTLPPQDGTQPAGDIPPNAP